MKLYTQLFLSILLTLSTCNFVYSQEDCRVWVKTYNQTNSTGYLRDVLNESIIVESESMRCEVDVENIYLLKFRKKNRVIKSALIGTLIGAVGGFVIGVSDGSNGEKFLFGTVGAAVFAVPGILIGTLVGSYKYTISINGNKNTFDSKRKEILEYRRVL